MKNENVQLAARMTKAPRCFASSKSHPHWPWLLGAGCSLLIILGLVRAPVRNEMAVTRAPMSEVISNSSTASLPPSPPARHERLVALGRKVSDTPEPAAEEIVAGKVAQLGRNRRDIAHAMARKLNVEVPDDVEHFFESIERGQWDDVDARFKMLLARKKTPEGAEELGRLWGPILEAYGAAEQAHEWPAQKLLDYGNAVLDSLRPGMIYVGGTDEGRYIPTLLNETSNGERHVILTQNALADQSYLQYLEFLHGDQIAALTQQDSERAFKDYLSDAQKRFEHDQQFPDEPKQLRPGEDVRFDGNKIQVSGQVAVMGINEKLLQTLMEKNPDRPFALQESYPFKSTYADAVPLGSIMELRANDPQSAYTAEGAAQTVDYWQTTAQRLLSDPEALNSPSTMKSFAKLAMAQGRLLAEHSFSAEAEQAHRLAATLAPSNPEAVLNYVNLLVEQKRPTEAIPVLETALAATPDNRQFRRWLAGIKGQNRH